VLPMGPGPAPLRARWGHCVQPVGRTGVAIRVLTTEAEGVSMRVFSVWTRRNAATELVAASLLLVEDLAAQRDNGRLRRGFSGRKGVAAERFACTTMFDGPKAGPDKSWDSVTEI
jgi:hypothetical protein